MRNCEVNKVSKECDMNKVTDTTETVKRGPLAFGAAAVTAPCETKRTDGKGNSEWRP